MTRSLWWGPLLAALLVVGVACPALAKDDGWWSGLDEGLPVQLGDVLANAEPYRHRTITFTCVFHSRENTYDPLHTPFNAERFDNFSVWPDGTPLWEAEAFHKDYPFVYIPRNHPDRDALLSLPSVTRIQVTGKIRAVTRAGAFFEVFSWRRTGHRLGQDVVQAVLRGDNYIKSGARDGYQLAARQYQEALRPDLPEAYAQRIRARLAQALRKLGFVEEARRVEASPALGTDPLPEPAREGPGIYAPTDPGGGFEPLFPVPASPGTPDGAGARPPAGSSEALGPAPTAPSSNLPPATGPLQTGPVLPDDALPGRRNPGALPRGPVPAPSGSESPPAGGFPPPVPDEESTAPGEVVPPDAEGPGSPDGPAPDAPPPPVAKSEKSVPPSGIPPTRRSRLSGVK